MAETTLVVETAHPAPGGGIMRRLNVFTGVGCGFVLAALGYLVAHALWIGNDQGSDQAVIVMEVCWVVGFLLGIGAFAPPLRWILGRDQTVDDEMFLAGKDQGVWRYFRFTTDHKVVGTQYLVLAMSMFAVGGLLAMVIRTELFSPGEKLFGGKTHNSLVGVHGIIMIVSTIIMIVGPWGNFVMPLMIGARDMAFPRLNALSFWTLFPAVPVFLSIGVLGGIPTGWVAYAPLSDQAPPGMDAFAIAIILFVLSSAIGAVNLIVTAVTMRAKGMTWNRTPIFVVGVVSTSLLGLVALPCFQVAMLYELLDRSQAASFFVPDLGGSQWLYANLFWLMGHPEVYVILLPGVAAVLEIAPVFSRKPLFGYRIAVVGIIAIVALSIMVWAHHMFVSGWAPLLGGPFMLTTELISIPTGLIFLAIVGTIWRGNIWLRLPMLFVYGFLWNFMIGGITGIYLSDVPADNELHGALFVTAHFHYTLLGGAMIGGMAAIVFWFSKMTGRMFDERLGTVAFWLVMIGFNTTFLSMFYNGLQGMPRRVATYAPNFETANRISTIGAYVIASGMLIFLYATIHSWRSGTRASANPWHAKSLEWFVPSPPPLENFEVLPVVTGDAYGYGEPDSHHTSLAPVREGTS
ncbi:MAG: cbb3-type cytochrome c oxidase subunit I [Actinomycetes bacterium]